MVGILGSFVLALGTYVLVLGLVRPRRITLLCEGSACTLVKTAILRTTSIAITGLRGATAEEKRRGARDNVRLVLRADTEIEAAPWVSRGDSNAAAFRATAAKITEFAASDARGSLKITIELSQTLVLWMTGATLLALGGVLIAIYFTP
ncbi:MAG TPA: hypothetical protein VG755_32380 [Nannocystaceae bacterium]|nr:hypothetical protein [Nannocystaceae bacterium]